MRWLVMLAACGGSTKPIGKPVVATTNPCVQAYGEYEARWRTARSEELTDLEFDEASTEEVISNEVATLPTRADLVKLRNQYTAISVFLPDAPWPLALDAAEVAIGVCGEAAAKPT